MFFLKIFLIICISCVIRKTAAILCYECINQSTNDDCMKNGKITKCMSNQYSCQTEVRLKKYWTNGRLITKRCKQTNACITSFLENAANCRPHEDDTVCFCCCHQSMCNLHTNECLKVYSRVRRPQRVKDQCKNLDGLRKTGQLTCTDKYNVGSTCHFIPNSISSHSEFSGKCLKNSNGFLTWRKNFTKTTSISPVAPGELVDTENPEPACDPVIIFEDQTVNCTNKFQVGSVCTFECIEENSVIDGDNSIRCIFSNGASEWDGLTPLCRPEEKPVEKQCKNLNQLRKTGRLLCTDKYNVGSTCHFIPNDPSNFIAFRTECLKDENGVLTWRNNTSEDNDNESNGSDSSDAPGKLVDTTIPAQPGGIGNETEKVCRKFMNTKEFLDISCTNSTSVGSRCTFQCIVGHMLMPPNSSTLTCVHDNVNTAPRWTPTQPICRPLSCAGYEVENATVNCTNEFLFDSVCSVACNRGYAIRPQSFNTSKCLDNLTWTRAPPRCQPVHCPAYEVTHSITNCTEGSSLNSKCSAVCNSINYQLLPKNYVYSTCLPNGTWSPDPPCCAKVCPREIPMDMVFILDSSSSIGRNHWIEIKRFVVDFIGFLDMGPNSTNFAIFQYSRRVNLNTQISLNEYDNQTELQEAVMSMPYHGNGTWTGIALGHAAQFSLLPDNGNRPQFKDIVLVITDGQVNRKNDPFGPAQKLLEAGAKVFVIGIKSYNFGRHYTYKQLLLISGNQSERVFSDFPEVSVIYQAMHNAICEVTCGNS